MNRRTRLDLRPAGVALVALLAASSGPAAHAELTPTPSTGRGPFFPPEIESSGDADLRTVEGAVGVPRGTPLRIEGRIVDVSGAPIAGAEVYVWQVDAGGNYNHPEEAASGIKEPGDGELDPNFQYWGRTATDGEGRFVVETIVPAHYRAMGVTRPNHVHFEFRHPGFRRLATEMNFAGDPHFEADFVTSGFTPEQLAALQVETEPRTGGETLAGGLVARWTVVLAR